MVSQRYERVPEVEPDTVQPIPNSPPPSFHSRGSSPSRQHGQRRVHTNDVDPTLEDTFNVRSDDEDDDEDRVDDRQQLMHSGRTNGASSSDNWLQTQNSTGTGRSVNMTSFASSNDGVFANLNAKPERGEKVEEQPPSYEQAAADATPPYWETTILAPGMASDEVYIDGLPVGSVFSFAWNGIISMAFQLVGFLLTYLLHTTHAAKNGSRAGLGVTLISWGYQMKTTIDRSHPGSSGGSDGYSQPDQPNSHDFDPSTVVVDALGARDSSHADAGVGFAGSWLAYVVMVVGWVVLIKALMDFIRARRHEQLILQSPERGLSIPIVAEGEDLEEVV